MKKPTLIPRKTDTMVRVGSIDPYDFDGTIEEVIYLLQDIKDKYPDKQVTLDKYYDSSGIDIYVNVSAESEEEFEIRRQKYIQELAQYEEWQVQESEKRSKELYLKLKAKYENE